MSRGTNDSGLLVLSEEDVRRTLAMPAAIRDVADALARLSAGRARVPVRQALDGDGGDVLFMPGRLDAPSRIGAKAVSVFPDNPEERDLPAVNAGVLLVDPETGRPEALIAGNHLTAVRTGAGSGVAT
ncbi:MAG: ornithine cyclodeaminase, partial [Gemmatimonadota bacterium]